MPHRRSKRPSAVPLHENDSRALDSRLDDVATDANDGGCRRIDYAICAIQPNAARACAPDKRILVHASERSNVYLSILRRNASSASLNEIHLPFAWNAREACSGTTVRIDSVRAARPGNRRPRPNRRVRSARCQHSSRHSKARTQRHGRSPAFFVVPAGAGTRRRGLSPALLVVPAEAGTQRRSSKDTGFPPPAYDMRGQAPRERQQSQALVPGSRVRGNDDCMMRVAKGPQQTRARDLADQWN